MPRTRNCSCCSSLHKSSPSFRCCKRPQAHSQRANSRTKKRLEATYPAEQAQVLEQHLHTSQPQFSDVQVHFEPSLR